MTLDIISRKDSPVDEKSALNLLRIAMLVSPYVFISSYSSYFISLEERLRAMTDRVERLEWMKAAFPKFLTNYPQMIDKIDLCISNIKDYEKARKKHNLPPYLINDYMRVIEDLRWMENTFYKYLGDYIARIGLKPIQEFATMDRPTSVHFWFPDNYKEAVASFNKMIHTRSECRFLYCIIKERRESAMFDSSAMKTPLFKEGFDLESYDGNLIVSPEALMEFPALEILTAEQIRIIRHDFSRTLNDLHVFFDEFTRQSRPSETGENLCGSEKELIGALLSGTEYFKQAVNENLYIKYLLNAGASGKTSSLHLGLCSLNVLLKLYRELNLINPEFELYLRDNIFNDVDLRQPSVSLIVI